MRFEWNWAQHAPVKRGRRPGRLRPRGAPDESHCCICIVLIALVRSTKRYRNRAAELNGLFHRDHHRLPMRVHCGRVSRRVRTGESGHECDVSTVLRKTATDMWIGGLVLFSIAPLRESLRDAVQDKISFSSVPVLSLDVWRYACSSTTGYVPQGPSLPNYYRVGTSSPRL